MFASYQSGPLSIITLDSGFKTSPISDLLLLIDSYVENVVDFIPDRIFLTAYKLLGEILVLC